MFDLSVYHSNCRGVYMYNVHHLVRLAPGLVKLVRMQA